MRRGGRSCGGEPELWGGWGTPWSVYVWSAEPLTLPGWGVWKRTSCSNVISAIKNSSVLSCVCVWDCSCASVSGLRLGSQSDSRGGRQREVTCAWLPLSPLSCLSTRNKCCVVYLPDLFVTTAVSLLFTVFPLSLQQRRTMIIWWMSIAWILFEFFFFLVENSLRA